jgi:pilus assembly protein CpaD
MYARVMPLLLGPVLLLGACAGENGGVESVHQPVVERHDQVFDVQTSGYGLAPGEGQRLAGWLDSMGLRYGDRVAIDDGGDGSTAREEVAALASRYGVLLADRAPVTRGQIAPGTARVVVTRMSATVPGCPDHSRESLPNYSRSTSSDYGCALNSNLARMVADPGDLVRGVPGSPTSDPATGSKAINALRNAVPGGGGGTVVKSDAGGAPK